MIQCKDVSFGYGTSVLFEHLNFELTGGSCYGLLGLNGAGKTSLLKLLAGALFPRSGTISAFGRKPGARETGHLSDLYFVPEHPLAPKMTIAAWLMQQRWLRPAFEYDRFRALCADFGLQPDSYVHKLSFGDAKKFALAAAFSSGARMLFLDEPTNGLDIVAKAQFRRMLGALASPERIIVVSTHQVRELEHLLDPLLLLHNGKLVLEAGTQTLAACLSTARLTGLEGQPVVMARKAGLGYEVLLAEPGASLDLELVFEAAVRCPERVQAVLRGEILADFQAENEVTA